MTAQRLVSNGVTYQIVSRSLAPGKTEVIDLQGNFVRCITANVPFAIGFDGGPPQYFAQFIAARLPGNAMFSQITIDNSMNTNGLFYKLAIGQGQISDDRAGSFPPLDSAALATQTYVGTTPGAVLAGSFSLVGAFQPVAAAQTLFGAFLRQIIITSSIADVIQFGIGGAAYTDTATPQKGNKLLGFTGPQLVLSQQTSLTQNLGLGILSFQIPVQANIPFTFVPQGPLIIVGGANFGLCAGVTGSKLSATWDWHEVPSK